MKLSVANLKNIDWKQFAINHVEKIVLGVVALLVVFVVLNGTRWAEFTAKTPEGLKEEVSSNSKRLGTYGWPEEEQSKFPLSYEVAKVINAKKAPVDSSQYEYPGILMYEPVYKSQSPIKEAAYLPAENGIATFHRFILQTPPDDVTPEELAKAEEKEAEKAKDEPKGEFAPKQRRTTGPGLAGGLPSIGSAEADMRMMEEAEAEMARGYGTSESGARSGGAKVYGRGERAVSVRFVVPFPDQLKKIANAMGDPALASALMHAARIKDFELQRQEAPGGTTVWSNKDEDWEKVNTKFAFDVLKEALNWDEDVVDAKNISHVCTMSLPSRLTGNWTSSMVGHPDIPTLDEIAREKQREMKEKVAEQSSKLGVDGESPEDGGFASLQRNFTGMSQQVFSDAGAMDNMMSTMADQMSGSEESLDRQSMMRMGSQLISSPEKILFRYLDFDVKPGYAYRYRVRIIYHNPHADAPAEELASPEVGQGKTRTTPWSKPTPVATLDQDVNYYLAEVAPPKTRNMTDLPVANINIFQWVSEIGTRVQGLLPVTAGQVIGGKKETEVLRPENSFKKEELEFDANDLLVDLEGNPRRADNVNFHSDLDLPANRRGKVLKVDRMLVVNQFGDLEVHDPVSMAASKSASERRLENQNKWWEDLKEKDKPVEGEGGPDFEMLGSGSEAMMQMEMEMQRGGERGRRGRRSRQNPLRKYGGMGSGM